MPPNTTKQNKNTEAQTIAQHSYLSKLKKDGDGGDDADTSTIAWKWGGRNAEGTCLKQALRPVLEVPEDEKKAKVLIGIRGKWYDATKFVDHHPGGDVMLDFAGRDATAQFLAYHDEEKVLKYWKPVGTYEWDATAPGGDKLEGVYFDLYSKFKARGYFTNSNFWVAKRLLVPFLFLTTSLIFRSVYLSVSEESAFGLTAMLSFLVSALGLAGFWQQCGFLMHDLMHNQIFHNRKVDQFLGWLYGGVGFGISGRWWRDEHNEHHLFTNTVVNGVGLADPQMGETIWIQDTLLFPFVDPQWLLPYILKIQHLIFLPILIFIGPIAIKIDSYRSEDRALEFCSVVLHWLWLLVLMASFPTYMEGFFLYYMGSCFVGVLEIQLLVSHYASPWTEKDAAKTPGSFMRRQVEAVVDIDCPPWMDWFFGGLNLHAVHHLFPRMGSEHYRAAMVDINRVCNEHKIPIVSMTFLDAIRATLSKLKRMDTLFSIDPR
eukprot:m.134340 g.134340  ORF g.134340 m.134340 type:complete len:488 (+) comp14692_c1_seq1:105-1568(+)